MHPEPQAVKKHAIMSHILHCWHYNAQKFSDWHRKVNQDETYLHNGWVWEVKTMEESGNLPKTGITTLSFN